MHQRLLHGLITIFVTLITFYLFYTRLTVQHWKLEVGLYIMHGIMYLIVVIKICYRSFVMRYSMLLLLLFNLR